MIFVPLTKVFCFFAKSALVAKPLVSIEPVEPELPVSPFSPFGMPKLRVKLGAVPVILAVALLPATNVDTVPIVILGVAPVSPLGPCSP